MFDGVRLAGWCLWTDRVLSLSPGLAQRTPINNTNIIIIMGVANWATPVAL